MTIEDHPMSREIQSDQPLVNQSGQGVTTPSSGNGPSGDGTSDSGDGQDNGPDPQTQIKELRRQVSKLGEERSTYAGILARATQTPEWESVKARLKGEDPSANNTSEEVQSLLGELSASPEAAKKLARLFEIQGKAVRADVLREVGPTLQKTQQQFAETAFQRGIKEAGLDPAVLEDPDFQDYQNDLENDNGWVKALPPEARARYLADNFKFHVSSADKWRNENRRIDLARQGTLEQPSGATGRQAGNLAGRVEIPPGADMKTIMQALEQAGGDESKIVFV